LTAQPHVCRSVTTSSSHFCAPVPSCTHGAALALRRMGVYTATRCSNRKAAGACRALCVTAACNAHKVRLRSLALARTHARGLTRAAPLHAAARAQGRRQRRSARALRRSRFRRPLLSSRHSRRSCQRSRCARVAGTRRMCASSGAMMKHEGRSVGLRRIPRSACSGAACGAARAASRGPLLTHHKRKDH
jgi:hypothetical protein